ncbi:hypothetical protein [Agathobacter sp.]
MKGQHRVQVWDNTVRYDFVLSRNITIIRGDSGTGKTTLYNLIQEVNQKQNSGITLNSDCSCFALTDFDWEEVISRHPASIIFVDENFSWLKSEKFASIVNSADNYFVLITRAYLPMLAYSINEVYSMHVSGKYVTLNNEYEITINELKNVYSKEQSYPPKNITPDYVLCEDSNSGYELFDKLSEKISAECHSAHGKSNVPEKMLDFDENPDKKYLVIVDGAAYGSEMGATVRYVYDHPNCFLYAPESFEWLLLKVMFSKDPIIYGILKNPSDYAESTKYLSWERYFTHVLEEHTKGTDLEYHKKKLNKKYLYSKAVNILSKFLLDSNINFDKCIELEK